MVIEVELINKDEDRFSIVCKMNGSTNRTNCVGLFDLAKEFIGYLDFYDRTKETKESE